MEIYLIINGESSKLGNITEKQNTEDENNETKTIRSR
jgi:hypothetical protein